MATTNIKHMKISTLCFLCSEQFKDPKVLPCFHTFCKSCLHSKILTLSCTSTELQVGFNCPYCQAFIPAPGPIGNLEQWTDFLPSNEDVVTAIEEELPDLKIQRMCKGCKTSLFNVGAEVKKFCKTCEQALCTACAIHHTKRQMTGHHIITEIDAIDMTAVSAMENVRTKCKIHKKNQTRFFCTDHNVPCCMFCRKLSHKDCVKVIPIEKKAHCLKDTKEALLLEMDTYLDLLMKCQKEEEANLTEIENIATDVTSEVKAEISLYKKKILQLENKFLDITTKTLKENNSKLESSLKDITSRKDYLRSLKDSVEEEEKLSDIELVVEHNRISNAFRNLQSEAVFQKVEIEFAVKYPPVIELDKIVKLPELDFLGNDFVLFDIKIAKMDLIFRFPFQQSSMHINGGAFLPGGCLFTIASNGVLYMLDKKRTEKMEWIKEYEEEYTHSCRKEKSYLYGMEKLRSSGKETPHSSSLSYDMVYWNDAIYLSSTTLDKVERISFECDETSTMDCKGRRGSNSKSIEKPLSPCSLYSTCINKPQGASSLNINCIREPPEAIRFTKRIQEPEDAIPFNTKCISKLQGGIQLNTKCKREPQGAIPLNTDYDYTGDKHLSSSKDHLYVAKGTTILKLNKEGEKVKQYTTTSEVISVAISWLENIVYLTRECDKVLCMNPDERKLFEYSNPDLRKPSAVAIDCAEHIYVTGFKSNNVHILSYKGNLIRIIQNIENPKYIKFSDETMVCFLVRGEEYSDKTEGCVEMFEFKYQFN